MKYLILSLAIFIGGCVVVPVGPPHPFHPMPFHPVPFRR